MTKKVLRLRTLGGRGLCERCAMSKRCECVCVKEIYFEEASMKGLRAAEMYIEELRAKKGV